MKITISTTYTLIWQIIGAENYKFTQDGVCINSKIGKIIKKTICGGSVGYCINGKFKTTKSLRKKIEKIPKQFEYPF